MILRPTRHESADERWRESLSAALGTNSEPPHRCRESCDVSFAEREEPPRDILPQEFSHLNGPNFFSGQPLAGHARRCLLGGPL